VDGADNVFVADVLNSTLRKITPAGVVTTYAGVAGDSGYVNGDTSVARLSYPTGVALDLVGDVFFVDNSNTIRYVAAVPANVVFTLAGVPTARGYVDGPAASAQFNNLQGIAVQSGPAAHRYVVDANNYAIRKNLTSGTVSTLAGGTYGSVDGTGTAAQFSIPGGIAIDAAGNVFVADTYWDTIRAITPGGVVTTIGGKSFTSGSTDGAGTAARFYQPYGIAVDSAGILYIADTYNDTIRKGVPSTPTTTAQTITFGALANKTYGDAPFALSASAVPDSR
jgi:hypothetical protein